MPPDARQRVREGVDVDQAVAPDWQLADGHPGRTGGAGRFAHGGVLDGGAEKHGRAVVAGRGRVHTSGADGAQHGQIGRLGPTRAEHDLGRVASHEGRDFVACLLEQALGALGGRMAPGGVAEYLGAHLVDGRRHLGAER